MDDFVSEVKKHENYDGLSVDMFFEALKDQIKLNHVYLSNEEKTCSFNGLVFMKSILGYEKYNDSKVDTVVNLSVSNEYLIADIAPSVTLDDYWDYPSIEITLFPKSKGSLLKVSKGYYNEGMGLLISFTTGPDEANGVFEASVIRNDDLTPFELKNHCEKRIGSTAFSSPSIKYGNQKINHVFKKTFEKIKEKGNVKK